MLKKNLKIPGAFVENKGGGFRHAFISPQFFPLIPANLIL